MIQAITFDFDGTLMDSMKMWHSLIGEYMKSKGEVLTDDLEQMVVTTGFVKGMEKLNEIFHFEDSNQEVLLEIEEMIMDKYLHHVDKKPYADETLQFCKDQGYPLALASASSYKYITEVVEKRGMGDFFSIIQTCDKVDLAKKEVAFYHTLADDLGLEPHEILFIDDAAYALEAANKAGFQVVAVYDEESKKLWDKGLYNSFPSVKDLKEFQEYVKNL